MPVDNLTMPGRRRVRVGDVEFRGFTQIRAQKALAQIKGFLSRNPAYAKNRKFIEQYIDQRRKHDIGTLVGSICAETEVYGKADDAFSDALPKIEEAIACLKLFHYWNDDFYGRYFGILGKVPRKVWRPMLIYPRGTGFIGNECVWMGPLYEFELDSDRIRFMQDNAFPKLSKILAGENRSNIEQRIVSAVLWFAKATDVILTDRARAEPSIARPIAKGKTRKPQAEMMAPYDRLVKLTVALESLLILDESEPVASTLADRTALLLGKKYSDRKAIFEFVKRMYRRRSGVVHHGGKGILEGELRQLTSLVQSVIITLLKNVERERLSSIESLQEWFLRKKLG